MLFHKLELPEVSEVSWGEYIVALRELENRSENQVAKQNTSSVQLKEDFWSTAALVG